MGDCLIYALLLLSLPYIVYSIPQATIGATAILGSTDRGVHMFLGLPYAEPPVGALRLRPPVLRPSYSSKAFDARRYGPSCPQAGLPTTATAEDCLSLNVFRPTNATGTSRLPVMVWIHGGGFFSGSSSLYPGNALVSTSIQDGTPIIYVSINYRLGPLGFPAGADATTDGILNLGLHDQITALRWVQANIHSFGGDSSKVTLFGESAGATSLSLLLLTSRLDGLARAAILQSPGSSPLHQPTQLDARWSIFLDAVPSCASADRKLDCLRSADTQSVAQAAAQAPIMGFLPVIDGPGGSNKDEGTIFISQQLATEEEIRLTVPAAFSPPILSEAEVSEKLDAILTLYPNVPSLGSPFGTGNQTFGLSPQYKRAAAIFGDIAIESYRRRICQDVSQKGGTIWGYQFADVSSSPSAFLMAPFGVNPQSAAPGSLGVTHTNEIDYIFGTLSSAALQGGGAQALSSMMRSYWVSFAATLDPNRSLSRFSTRPLWKPYRYNDPMLLRLNGTTSRLIVDDFRKNEIAFFQNNPDFSLS